MRPLVAAALALVGLSTAGAAPQLRPAPGVLLVAQHDLRDPNFAETVVLILRYDAEGALGLVINRRSRIGLAELFPEWVIDGDREPAVFLGGPVTGGEIFVLLRTDRPPKGARKVIDGLFVTQSRETLQELIASETAGEFRVFAGYAGWAQLQLDAEIARGDWHLAPPDLGQVFDEQPEELWRRLVPAQPTEVARRAERSQDGGAESVPGLPVLLQAEP